MLEFLHPQGSSVHSPWTLPWIAERWKPIREEGTSEDGKVNFVLDSEAASDELAYAWKFGIGKRWLPEFSANLVVPHNFSEATGTSAYVCTSLFDEAGLVAADIERLLSGHGQMRTWQQWKIVNYIISTVLVSNVAYSLALSRWNGREAPFPLANFLPRSILCPFDGTEACNEKHIVKSPDGTSVHYASHRTTFSFVKASEELSSRKRWDSGNFCAEYIRVAERVANRTAYAWVRDDEENSWGFVKAWKSMPNYYYATAAMERLVNALRSGRARLERIDISRIAEWYFSEYLADGAVRKGRRINARKEFPDEWDAWTGIRPSGTGSLPEMKCSSFSKAMKMHSAEIASGKMVYVTHIEKIMRGIFIGSGTGIPLADLMEERTPSALKAAMMKRKPKPKAFSDSSDSRVIENDVWFDWEFLFDFLERSPKAAELDSIQISQLEKMAEESWINEQGAGVYRPLYRRSLHGRYYGSGNAVQMLPKWLRKNLFGKYYVEADLNSAVVSILANQAADAGYEGDMSELEAMAADKNAYRDSLAAAECGIDRKKVKEMTTMIGYGCKCSPKRLMTEAEWCCLVEQYDIEETQYDIMASRAHSALFKGISDPKEKMAIALWSEMNRVVSYCGQMRSAGSFVIGANTARLDGRTVLRNAWGTELAVGGGKRLSFGKKLAHIYQGAESKLLWTIWDKFEVGGKRLRDIEGGFGLFIHDGFGIRRDIAERLGDPAKALREFAMREFGWNLAYSCE